MKKKELNKQNKELRNTILKLINKHEKKVKNYEDYIVNMPKLNKETIIKDR